MNAKDLNSRWIEPESHACSMQFFKLGSLGALSATTRGDCGPAEIDPGMSTWWAKIIQLNIHPHVASLYIWWLRVAMVKTLV